MAHRRRCLLFSDKSSLFEAYKGHCIFSDMSIIPSPNFISLFPPCCFYSCWSDYVCVSFCRMLALNLRSEWLADPQPTATCPQRTVDHCATLQLTGRQTDSYSGKAALATSGFASLTEALKPRWPWWHKAISSLGTHTNQYQQRKSHSHFILVFVQKVGNQNALIGLDQRE